MKINAYLNFDGRCAQAFRFYAEVLGGTIGFMQTFAESPMADQVPPEMRDQVMHVRLDLGDQMLLGSDAPGGRYQKPQGFAVSLIVSASEAERIFPALAEGGTVQMPLQKTFWAAAFGMVTYRFGTPWIVNGEG
jgi:PhnB protein